MFHGTYRFEARLAGCFMEHIDLKPGWQDVSWNIQIRSQAGCSMEHIDSKPGQVFRVMGTFGGRQVGLKSRCEQVWRVGVQVWCVGVSRCEQVLGDGLCWVYDPPIRLYDELSISDLHSFSMHFLFTARYFLHTHVAHARALTSSLQLQWLHGCRGLIT